MAYKKHLGGKPNNWTIGFDEEISKAEKALQEACYALVDTAVKLLKKKAESYIEIFYNESYKPIEKCRVNGVWKDGYMRHYRLYKSLHPWVQNNLNKQGNIAVEGQAFTVYGGLRVNAQGMKDYENQLYDNPPTTSASDVLNWTLLGHTKGGDGYHGWHGSHPGKQIEGALEPIQEPIDFVKNLEEYFESQELYDKASEAAWAVIDRYR